MPAETNTDKIRELERQMATLVERVDYLRRDIDRGDQRVDDAVRTVHDLSQQQILLAERVGRIEKNRDEGESRRWDVWKILLTAFIASLLTQVPGWIHRLSERLRVEQPAEGPPVRAVR